jgi:hypothetical protein
LQASAQTEPWANPGGAASATLHDGTRSPCAGQPASQDAGTLDLW